MGSLNTTKLSAVAALSRLICFLIILLLPLLTRAQSNQSIYTGTSASLAAPWQNWSWCSTNLGATNYVCPGDTYSAQITFTGGYQGFYVESPGVNTILYTNLTFWINGGSAGGQQIAVYGLVNNAQGKPVNLDNYIAGGSVAAGQWQQVTIPLADLGVANTANVDGFWLFEPTGSAQPSFYVDNITLTAASIPSPINLAVNAGSKVRTVDSRIFGINTAVWDSDLDTGGTISLLTASNTRILRFPGGSLSDTYNWQTNLTVGDSTPWASNFDSFAAVVTGLKAQAFVTANYGSGTAAEAAAWVTYSNVTKGYGIKYWEIGNEVYGSWEYDTHAVHNDPYTYAVQVQAYIAAMKAVDPTIKIGVVAVTGEDSYANNTNHPATNPVTGVVHNGWTPVMLATLKSLGVTPDFLIYHRYEQNPGSENDEGLLLAAATWPNDAANLRMMLNDYLGASTAAGVELVCTENNSVSYNPGKQSTSLVNGLYVADSVGNLLQTEFNAMTWWDLRNGQQTGNNNSASLYGWRQYGDYGVLDPNNAGYPTYYAMKLLQYLGAGGDSVVSVTSNYPLLSSYSVLRQNGSLSVLVINKSATNALTGAISLSNFSPSSSATVYSYGMAQDNAAETGTGSTEIAQTTLNNVSANFSYSFPAYSMSIISISPTSTVVPKTVTFSPSVVTGGASSTGTVTLSSTAPTGGLVVSLSSTSGATVPGSVTVTAGKTSATFKATTTAIATNTTATVTATANGSSASGTLTVNGPVPSSLACSPTTIAPGHSTAGKLTISSAAPVGGMTVGLNSSGPVNAPASVTVPAGATTVSFTVTGVPVSSNTTATITAAANGISVKCTVTVAAPSPTALALSPASAIGGNSSTGTVTINGPAPTGGLTVTLGSTGVGSSSVSVPASVTVAAGAKTATFTVSTSAVSGNTSATITASANGTSASHILTVTAPTPTSVTLSPNSVISGSSSTGTLTISGPAPAGGLAVSLNATGSASSVSIPSSVTVAAGKTTATFIVSTSAVVSKSTCAINATYNGVTKSATFVINAATLLSLTFSPASVKGGTTASLTVTLSGPAPAGGATITLTSNKPTDVTLPSLTITAGSSSVTVPISTAVVTSNTVVTVTGSYNGINKGANLTLTP